MRHIMHTVEHAALIQAAAYGKHRTPQRTPAKLPGVCAPCPACRMELHNA